MSGESAIHPSFTNESLLRILICEIAKDGGVTLVNSLPISNPLISAHLNSKNLKKEKIKLVAFLEAYPRTFQVDTTGKNQIVRLLDSDIDTDHVRPGKLAKEAVAVKFKIQLKAKKELADKTMYELQKRLSKYKRRSKVHRSSKIEGESCATMTMHDVPGAQIEWLTKKVQNELHRYTRALSKKVRPTGVVPFSNGWLAVAKTLYVDFLNEMCSYCSIDADIVKTPDAPLTDAYCEALHGVILSIQTCPSEAGQHRVHFVPMPNHQMQGCGSKEKKIERIAKRVKNVLQNNAPPIGGMDFGMLLRDQQLRSLTGGMDVRKLIEDHTGLFQGLRVFQDKNRGCRSKVGIGSDGDRCNFTWYIEIVKENHAMNSDNGRDLVEDSICNDKSRMAADEVGTFSLTKPRLATAMAKMIWRACKYGHLGKLDENESDSQATSIATASQRDFSDEMVCIDITASVGGNTIAFAKVCSRVYAYEIDKLRVEYLKRNIVSFLDAADRSKVVVECTDSMEAIQKLAKVLRPILVGSIHNDTPFILPRVAVFVDPPFGGIHYRSMESNGCASLNLGEDMPLTRVVAIVSNHLSPVTIGLKLPLHFDVASFVAQAKEETLSARNSPLSLPTPLSMKTLIIKKMERQLFVILDVK